MAEGGRERVGTRPHKIVENPVLVALFHATCLIMLSLHACWVSQESGALATTFFDYL